MSLFNTLGRWASAAALLVMLASPVTAQSKSSSKKKALEETTAESVSSFLPINPKNIVRDYEVILDSKASGPILSVVPQIIETKRVRMITSLDKENNILYLEIISRSPDTSIMRNANCYSVGIACPTRVDLNTDEIEQRALVRKTNLMGETREEWINLHRDETSKAIISGTIEGVKKLAKSAIGTVPVLGDISREDVAEKEKQEDEKAKILSREIDAEIDAEHHMTIVPDYVENILTLYASKISIKIPYHIIGKEEVDERFVASFNLYFARGTLLGKLQGMVPFQGQKVKETKKAQEKRASASELEKFVFNTNELPRGFSLITNLTTMDLRMFGIKTNPGEMTGVDEINAKVGYTAIYTSDQQNKENMLTLDSYIPGANFSENLRLFAGPNASNHPYVEYIAVYKGNNSYLVVSFIPKGKFNVYRTEIEKALKELQTRLGLELYWHGKQSTNLNTRTQQPIIPDTNNEHISLVGPENQPAEKRTGKPKPALMPYAVRRGDTLTSISEMYYGESSVKSIRRIYELNRSVIGPNADDLKIGSVLNIDMSEDVE